MRVRRNCLGFVGVFVGSLGLVSGGVFSSSGGSESWCDLGVHLVLFRVVC